MDDEQENDWIDKEKPIIQGETFDEKLEKISRKYRRKKKKFSTYQNPGVDEANFPKG